ncbi:MAG: PocR ligand-binding domain-containing protein [Bacillota bacterium]
MIDFKRVVQLSNSYANATKIPAFVINNAGKTVAASDTYTQNRFCALIHQNSLREELCCRTHLYGSYQAERFGESYIYFCPFGLVHWVAPILEENRMVYSIVAGPVLMSSPENALIGEILVKNGLSKEEIRGLYREVANIAYLEPHTVNDMACLLLPVASFLSRDAPGLINERREFFTQQASIGAILQTLKDENAEKTDYPLAKEKELILKIKLGDKKGAQEVLNEIFGYIFFSRGNEIPQIKTRVIELVVLLSRAAIEGGADNELIFGLNYNYLLEIQNLQSIDEIAFWLSKVMARFTDCVFNLTNVKNIDIIYKAVAYLRENYMHQISLEKVAKVVYLSPSYFSKLFKDEMKCNFNAYLNNLRVENSKKFLLDETIPLADVAGLVGFQDQSYYTKVFKKISKTSPGEFRRSRGYKSAKE